MSMKECPQQYPQIRREVYGLWIILLIFIPTIIIFYINLQPKMEKVYSCEFNELFEIQPFTIQGLNLTSNLLQNFTFQKQDYGTKFKFDLIQFGFNDYDETYSASDYKKAYLFENDSNLILYGQINRGYYLIREFKNQFNTFDILTTSLLKFKLPTSYQLFYIYCHGRGLLNNTIIDINFYQFCNTLKNDQILSQCSIMLYGLLFNHTIYDMNYYETQLYPYSIELTINVLPYYNTLFDFNFR